MEVVVRLFLKVPYLLSIVVMISISHLSFHPPVSGEVTVRVISFRSHNDRSAHHSFDPSGCVTPSSSAGVSRSAFHPGIGSEMVISILSFPLIPDNGISMDAASRVRFTL